jgi:transcriptional regulator with XRE-family HTH domain
MGALGEQLRAAREDRELSLSAAAEATRIPINYLAALEEESLSAFTSDLHARGFLRNYAAFLNLDPEEMLDLYDHARGNPRVRKTGAAASPSLSQGRGRSLLGADLLLGLVVVALLALAGYSVYLRQNHVEAPPTPGPPPTPTATPMPVYEGTSYSLDVQLNFAEHTLDVQQRIDYTNMTSETLPLLILNVHPNHSRNTFELHDVKVDLGDGELIQPETNLLDVRMQVDLPRPLTPEDHVALFLEYTLSLPKIDPSEEFSAGGFGYSNRAVSLGNWYPVMAPYREEEGWYGLKYFPVGDPYVTEVADYEVTINTTQDLIVAGTGTETRQGNRWRYEVERARSFAFAASDKYQIASTQVGEVTIHSYYFPDSKEAGEAVLDTAASALELFVELYGPYPFSDYRVAETEFAGGMEFSGLTFLGAAFYNEYDGTSRTPLIPLAAHEVAHQWFYGLVGNDQLAQPWLDEAPAEYSAYLYYERFLPEDTDWWWFYAVDQWAPTGKIDNLIYVFRDNREYMDAVYRRGAQFMRDLRAAMGDPAFFGFLQEYQRRYAYQLAESRDFFALVQEFTTADLVPLQEEYFRQRILP